MPADLAITMTSPELFAGSLVTSTMMGALLGAFATIPPTLAGFRVPAVVSVVVFVAGCGVGAMFPAVSVRSDAAVQRRDFVHALSAYLDCLILLLASGLGPDAAMQQAAQQGHGPAFDLLQRAASRSRLGTATVWQSYKDLADEIAVPQLAEIASAGLLAGEQGAAIRDSLTAKARSMRAMSLAAEAADGHRRSNTMYAPIVLIALAFIIFVMVLLMKSLTLAH
jgi:tight adherence protein C